MAKSNANKRMSSVNKTRNVRSSEQMMKMGVGLPPKLRVRLRVSTSANLNHAGTIQSLGVTCNDPYRPFINITTSEVPAYLAYLSQAYENLYVTNSSVRTELVNSTVSDSITTVLSLDSNDTGTITINDAAESRDATTRVIGYFSAGNNRAVHQAAYQPGKYQGIAANSPDNICKGGAAPPNPYYYVLSLQSVAGGTGNVAAHIQVEYDVWFTELKKPSP